MDQKEDGRPKIDLRSIRRQDPRYQRNRAGRGSGASRSPAEAMDVDSLTGGQNNRSNPVPSAPSQPNSAPTQQSVQPHAPSVTAAPPAQSPPARAQAPAYTENIMGSGGREYSHDTSDMSAQERQDYELALQLQREDNDLDGALPPRQFRDPTHSPQQRRRSHGNSHSGPGGWSFSYSSSDPSGGRSGFTFNHGDRDEPGRGGGRGGVNFAELGRNARVGRRSPTEQELRRAPTGIASPPGFGHMGPMGMPLGLPRELSQMFRGMPFGPMGGQGGHFGRGGPGGGFPFPMMFGGGGRGFDIPPGYMSMPLGMMFRGGDATNRPVGARRQEISTLPTMTVPDTKPSEAQTTDETATETKHQQKRRRQTESPDEPRPKPGGTEDQTQKSCCICMCDFEGGEELRLLPCFHRFHTGCIDRWLGINKTCPICKTPIDARHNGGDTTL